MSIKEIHARKELVIQCSIMVTLVIRFDDQFKVGSFIVLYLRAR